MIAIYNNENLRRVIALGFFDGVHLGHGALLRRTAEIAEKNGLRPSVLTFDTPPNKNVPMICSPFDRFDIIKRYYGINEMICLHFNEELRHMEWQRFIEWLYSDFGAAHLVAGLDFRFGYRGEGDTKKLRDKCAELNIGCDIIDPVLSGGAPISSTRIRPLIKDGDCESAAKLLGHRYQLTDIVRSGHRVGRVIGSPTVNMRFEEGVLVPKHGVYISKTRIENDGDYYISVTNIGLRPTFNGGDDLSVGDDLLVETHILNYSGDLYGNRVCVELYKYLRAEWKFTSGEELKKQIERDSEEAIKYFGA